MSKRATPRTRTPITSRPSRHVRDALERRMGKPTPAQQRFAKALKQQGFAVLAVGEGKVAGPVLTETVSRALVMRRDQPGVTVWAYSNGKWVAIVERFGETTMLEGDSFEEVEEWYYRQVSDPPAPAPQIEGKPPYVCPACGEEHATEDEAKAHTHAKVVPLGDAVNESLAKLQEDRGYTYRDKRRVTA